MRHFHLDPVGGVAGDMFVGALLDAFPGLTERVIAAVRAAGLHEAVRLGRVAYDDGVLSGSRFEVQLSSDPARAPAPTAGHVHANGPHHHEHRHDHHPHHHDERAAADPDPVSWPVLHERLARSALPGPVRDRAIGIFAVLADAEARVHGKTPGEVTFHEVGAWDSIADIVAAACLIEELGPCTWSIAPVPLGSGRVQTAHGMLPVPAPATVLLLDGLRCFDDGRPGERVTPTGAAILKHLAPQAGMGTVPRVLQRVGYGFGTRRFEGLSNVLRVVEFAPVAAAHRHTDQVAVIRFEVDDQTAEDLALGLDRLRALDGVLDVSQMALTGKRGRLLSGIRILAIPTAMERVTAACFHETTTLGLRVQLVDRVVLERRHAASAAGVRVKLAQRAAGPTAKAEAADLAAADGHEGRRMLRAQAEHEALYGMPDDA